MRTPGEKQDLVLVAARFPRDQYKQLVELARANLRSVGKECAVLTMAALREQEASKQGRRPDRVKSPGGTRS